MRVPRVLIAAAASGSGKTVCACGIMHALKERGIRLVSGKCGPDYIDPMFHREVLGVDAQNLDFFFYQKEALRALFVRHCKGAQLAVIEGVMGYYDGMQIDTDKGSSYDVARTLDTPVILVVPCKGSALSTAALLKGMIEFRKDSNIQGIILNRVSEMLYPRMKQMIETQLSKEGYEIPVIGHMPEHPAFGLESRHLGLVTPEETKGLKQQLHEAGRILEQTIDWETFFAIADGAPEMEQPADEKQTVAAKEVPVAVARDEAFCFYYKDNLELLKALGCKLVPFSPLRDPALPQGVQGVILGGGYPEEHARALSENKGMLESIRKAVEAGMPCHAECGGFLYLHAKLTDREGDTYPMTGVFSGSAYPTEKLVRFGYVNLTAVKDGILLKKGETIRGHEFHYWDSTDNGEMVKAEKPDGTRVWECIHMRGALFAGFPHISYGSNPNFAERFVTQARQYGNRR